MAQTGFTPIQLYSSSTTGNTPAAADLLNSSGGSELAINIFDGKLFYKDSSGNVQVIGWKVVPVSAGGTGQTSYTDGQLLIGNSTGNTLTKATLTAGTGISITNGAGAITINATGGTGTVTSVSGTAPIAVATGTTTPVISISQATTSTNGYLSSTDWNTFNSKGSGTVTSVGGTGTVNGLTLTGTVTTTGNLTLGGTLDLSAPPTIGNATANTITGTTITANTKFAGTYFDATSSAGGNLRTSGGTACFQWGAGGGTNCTVDGSINMNGANAHIDMSPTGTGHVSINPTGVGDINNVIIGATTPKAITGTTITATTFSGSGASLTSIPNSALVNSTISGVALGGSLFNLTAGTGVTFSTGTTYNGSAAITINATGTGGTVTSVAALTLGTTGTDLSSTVANGTTTPVITLNVPTASATNRGALSSTDWSTFNGKAPGVTFTANYIPYGQGTTTLNQSAGLQFDGTNFTTTGYATATSFRPSSSTIPTTGLYLPAANSLGWATNSIERMRIDSSGNLALGVSSAAAKFDIAYSDNSRFLLGFGANLDNYYTSGASGAHIFRCFTTERMRLFNSGGVSIGNTTDPGATNLSVTGNVIQGAAAKGYNFTANTPAAGMTSQLLNWYEEGTFTPTSIGTTTAGTGTYSIQSGRYTRIGRTISIQLQLAWSAHTGTGNMKVAGLPFTSNSTLPSQMSIGAFNLALTALYFPLARQEQSTTQINLLQSPTGGGAWVGVPIDTSVDALEISGTYTV